MHPDPAGVLTQEMNHRIFDAVVNLDAASLRDEFTTALDNHGIDALICEIMIPVLRQVGIMWQNGELGVMHEHHVSNIVRSVVAEFRGPAVREKKRRVILACPPGELHDLPSHLFAAMLLER